MLGDSSIYGRDGWMTGFLLGMLDRAVELAGGEMAAVIVWMMVVVNQCESLNVSGKSLTAGDEPSPRDGTDR